jgi:hypothetical protein
MNDNEELRRMIRELLTKGISGPMPATSNTGTKYDFGAGSAKFRPPVPH